MRTRRLIASAAALPVILAAGVWTGLGGAGLGAESATPAGFTARLNGAQEVPKPKAVKATAQGTFTATLVRSGAGGTLAWKLTFQGLTGKATASHIHLGARGRAGAVKVSLCGPCRTGARGSARVDAKTIAALMAGTAYVNVHTARNAGRRDPRPDREVREASRAAAADGDERDDDRDDDGRARARTRRRLAAAVLLLDRREVGQVPLDALGELLLLGANQLQARFPLLAIARLPGLTADEPPRDSAHAVPLGGDDDGDRQGEQHDPGPAHNSKCTLGKPELQ